MPKTHFLFLAGILGMVLTATRVLPQDATGAAVDGLQMSIAHENASDMHITLRFRNTGSEELTIAPGTLYNCGHDGSRTDHVRINLVDAAGIAHRRLPYLGDGPPYAAGCGGKITLFVATLGPGESISLPLDLGKYLDLSDSKQYVSARFHAGTYSLQAELTVSPMTGPNQRPPIKTWIGTVSSNILQVRFDSEFAAPLDNYPGRDGTK